MRRIAFGLTLAALAIIPGTAFAQDANWDGHFHKGDFALEAGVGLGGYNRVFSLAVLPGAEWTIADWRIGGVVPLAFGAAGKGLVAFVPGYGVGFGAGGFGVLHMGFKNLDIPGFLQKFDWSAGLGIGAVIVPFDDPSFGLALPWFSGVSYFLKDNLALYLEGVYWYASGMPDYGGAAFGVRFKK
jgi:hypothetical protein